MWWSQESREELEACMASWLLGLEMSHYQSHCRLLAKATHKASPDLRGKEIINRKGKELRPFLQLTTSTLLVANHCDHKAMEPLHSDFHTHCRSLTCIELLESRSAQPPEERDGTLRSVLVRWGCYPSGISNCPPKALSRSKGANTHTQVWGPAVPSHLHHPILWLALNP